MAPREARRVAGVAIVIVTALAVMPAHALDFSLGWTGDFAAVADGGLQQGTHHMGLVEAGIGSQFEWASGRALQWHATLQHTYGGGFTSQWVGDLQTVSNIDADHGVRLLEAWVEADVADGWSVGAGKYDFNSEFDAIESGGLFLSSSQGIGPDISQSGAAGPSIFPHTEIGVRVEHRSGETSAMRGVVLDADGSSPNRGGPMFALEYQRNLAGTRLVLGGWGYSGDKACLADPGHSAKQYGVYASAERRFTENVVAYLRAGFANPDVEQIGRYFGGGIVYEGGVLPDREDSVGFAIGIARNGSDFRDAMRADGVPTEAAEYALEATWRIPLGEHFAVQPDLQYVIEPGTDPSIDDALVFILRIEASL